MISTLLAVLKVLGIGTAISLGLTALWCVAKSIQHAWHEEVERPLRAIEKHGVTR